MMRILGVNIDHLGTQTEHAFKLLAFGNLLVQLQRFMREHIGAELAGDRKRVAVVNALRVDEVDARVADKVRRLQIDRVGVQAQRGIDLGDLALLEQRDLRGHRQRFDLIVRDVDDRGAGLLVKTLQFRAHVDAKTRVEVRKRLVQKQELRARRDRAGDCNTLLLTAGKLVRIAIAILFDAHGFQRAHDRFLDLRFLHLFDFQTECDVLEHRHVRPQRVALEHEVEPALTGRFIERGVRVDDRLVVDRHGAVLRLFETGNNAQRGGFAAAGRSQKRHKVAVLDREVDVAQNMVLAVEFIDMT